jgi:hypothetical protein
MALQPNEIYDEGGIRLHGSCRTCQSEQLVETARGPVRHRLADLRRRLIEQNEVPYRKRRHRSVPFQSRFKMAVNTALWIVFTIAWTSSSAQQLPAEPEPQVAVSQSDGGSLLPAIAELRSTSPIVHRVPMYASVRNTLRPERNPRTVNLKFVLINGVHLGLGIADVELTQHSIANHHSHEGNPLMPASEGGQLSVSVGYAALGTITSYWLKRRRSPAWWIAPVGGIVGHGVGIATGLSH